MPADAPKVLHGAASVRTQLEELDERRRRIAREVASVRAALASSEPRWDTGLRGSTHHAAERTPSNGQMAVALQPSAGARPGGGFPVLSPRDGLRDGLGTRSDGRRHSNGDTEHNHDTVGLQRQLEESRSAVSRLEEKVAQLRSSEVQLRIRLELVQGDLAIKNDEVRELTRLRSKAAIYEANDSQIRALLARQDALVSELDKMRRFHETYNELIQKVEAAAAAGKVCLVSAKGSAVLTMEELRREIIRSVALD